MGGKTLLCHYAGIVIFILVSLLCPFFFYRETFILRVRPLGPRVEQKRLWNDPLESDEGQKRPVVIGVDSRDSPKSTELSDQVEFLRD